MSPNFDGTVAKSKRGAGVRFGPVHTEEFLSEGLFRIVVPARTPQRTTGRAGID